MGTKVVEVPEEILELLRASRLKARSEPDQVKTALAIHLFLEEVISIGKAAQLAEQNRVEFELMLSIWAFPWFATTSPTTSRICKQPRGFGVPVNRDGRLQCRTTHPPVADRPSRSAECAFRRGPGACRGPGRGPQCGSGLPGLHDLRSVFAATWLHIQPVGATADLARALAQLDPGESEAIVLAKDAGADAVLVDDRRARSYAQREGLQVLGTIGVLQRARVRGMVPSAATLLDQLRAQGFRVSADLVEQVRREENP